MHIRASNYYYIICNIIYVSFTIFWDFVIHGREQGEHCGIVLYTCVNLRTLSKIEHVN